MRTNRLGNTGLFVSELCLGTMTFGGEGGMWEKIGTLQQKDAEDIIGTAIDAGINFIDTANVYAGGKSEEITGQALKNLSVTRDEIVVATKAFGPMGEGPNQRGNSRYHIMEAAKGQSEAATAGSYRPVPDSRFRRCQRRSRKRCWRSTLWCSMATSVNIGVSNWGSVADHESAGYFRAARACKVRESASLLHGGRPGSGARNRAHAAIGKNGFDGVEPAGRWSAVRQIQPRG